jgi:hypothetical protein
VQPGFEALHKHWYIQIFIRYLDTARSVAVEAGVQDILSGSAGITERRNSGYTLWPGRYNREAQYLSAKLAVTLL